MVEHPGRGYRCTAGGERRTAFHATPSAEPQCKPCRLWRARLRIHEALALNESELERRRGALLVRRGKGGRRPEVGMDPWAWEHLRAWTDSRVELPVGPLFCVINGPTRGPR